MQPQFLLFSAICSTIFHPNFFVLFVYLQTKSSPGNPLAYLHYHTIIFENADQIRKLFVYIVYLVYFNSSISFRTCHASHVVNSTRVESLTPEPRSLHCPLHSLLPLLAPKPAPSQPRPPFCSPLAPSPHNVSR